jgi:DNA-binding transcriptional LysR family regulator
VDPSHLKTFLMVAEMGSFTAAARRQSFSQSAVSQQVRELEHKLRLRLFERGGRAVVLTPAGELLVPMAKEILAAILTATAAMEQIVGTSQGVLVVGATPAIASFVLPEVLGRYLKAQPGIKLRIQTGHIDTLLGALDDNTCDLVLLDEPPPPSKALAWACRQLGQDELVAVAAPGLLASLPPLGNVQALANWPCVSWPRESNIHALLEVRLADAGFDMSGLKVICELDNMDGMRRAALAGLGVVFVSRRAVTSELENGALVPIPLASFTCERLMWGLHAKQSSNKAIDTLLEAFDACAGLEARQHIHYRDVLAG